VQLDHARLWRPAQARQDVLVPGGRVYRIELEARAPGGAGDALWAELAPLDGAAASFDANEARLLVYPEQLGRQWRRHDWTFELPADAPAQMRFSLQTWSDTAIEVRAVKLAASAWQRPINLGGRLASGEHVYELVASCQQGKGPAGRIYVYRNRLCLPRSFAVTKAVVLADQEAVIEALRWRAEEFDLTREVLVAEPIEQGELTFTSQTCDLPGWPGGGREHRAADGAGTVFIDAGGPVGD
jgi:hypothetical protein